MNTINSYEKFINNTIAIFTDHNSSQTSIIFTYVLCRCKYKNIIITTCYNNNIFIYLTQAVEVLVVIMLLILLVLVFN